MLLKAQGLNLGPSNCDEGKNYIIIKKKIMQWLQLISMKRCTACLGIDMTR